MTKRRSWIMRVVVHSLLLSALLSLSLSCGSRPKTVHSRVQSIEGGTTPNGGGLPPQALSGISAIDQEFSCRKRDDNKIYHLTLDATGSIFLNGNNNSFRSGHYSILFDGIYLSLGPDFSEMAQVVAMHQGLIVAMNLPSYTCYAVAHKSLMQILNGHYRCPVVSVGNAGILVKENYFTFSPKGGVVWGEALRRVIDLQAIAVRKTRHGIYYSDSDGQLVLIFGGHGIRLTGNVSLASITLDQFGPGYCRAYPL